MSKKINAARDELIKAIKKHSKVVGDARVPLKKAERAAIKLQDAAVTYSKAVFDKSGLDTPFTALVSTGLDETTMNSLAAERDALTKSKKKD